MKTLREINSNISRIEKLIDKFYDDKTKKNQMVRLSEIRNKWQSLADILEWREYL